MTLWTLLSELFIQGATHYVLSEYPLSKQYRPPGGQASQSSTFFLVEVLPDTPISTFSRRSPPSSGPGTIVPLRNDPIQSLPEVQEQHSPSG